MQAEMRAGQQGPGVGADRVESDITEVEQAGKTDHDVQTEGEKNIEDREVKNAHPGLAAHGSDERQTEQRHGNQRDTKGGTGIQPLAHARSPVFSPNRPLGLNISTTISTMKAKMS